MRVDGDGPVEVGDGVLQVPPGEALDPAEKRRKVIVRANAQGKVQLRECRITLLRE